MAENLLQRLDFAINESEMTTVVGTANGNSGTALPALLVHGYNSITVGVTDGTHASSANNSTYLYGNGRIKPEIVAPHSLTSFSTPMVSSAAAMLHEAGAGTDAVRSEPLKAILLAGATKDEFTSWSRTPDSPLDREFGAGELNIYHSYFMIKAPETDGSTGIPSAPATAQGWDYESQIEAGGSRYYQFEVAEDTVLGELSIVLTWNIDVRDLNSGTLFSPLPVLADMNLELYDSSNGFLGTLIDSSVSSVDNVEHIYLKNLMPGTYHLRVTSDLAWDYGLAWRSSVVDAPVLAGFSSKQLDGVVSSGQLTDTIASDDLYLEIDPSPTTNPRKQKVDLIVIHESPVANPDFLGFRLEAAMAGGPAGDVTQEIRLWNLTDQMWETIDFRPAETVDTIVKIQITGDPARFVHPLTGEILARVTWQSPEFAGSTFNWSIDLDQMVFQATE
jgi:hypothetical protein